MTISIGIAIAVAVVVAVLVAIAAVAMSTVECHTHVLVLLCLVHVVDVWQETTVEHSGTDDEECGVGIAVDDVGICHNLDWRTVEEDVVVFTTEFIDHVGKT